MMRSIVGSFARLRKSAVCAIAPLSSKSLRKKRAVSMLTPIAPNTIAKFSACESSVSFCATSEACRQICAATSLCGRPAAEKSGIFWPRAIEFMTSMALTPVWIIALG